VHDCATEVADVGLALFRSVGLDGVEVVVGAVAAEGVKGGPLRLPPAEPA